MSACCGKSKSDDTMLGEQAMGPSEIEKNEACSVQLQQVHQFLRDAAQPSKKSKKAAGDDDSDVNEASVSKPEPIRHTFSILD